MMRAAIVACLLVLAWTGAALGGPPSPRKQAAALSEVARLRAAHAQYDESVALLDQAYALDPDPTYILIAAKVLEKKGDLAAARQRYERFLQVEKDPKQLRRGRERLDALLDRIPGGLVTEVTPPGARVAVDGNPVEPGVTVYLRRGPHRVEASLAGHETDVRTVDVSPGVETRLRIDLKPVPTPAAVLPAPVAPPPVAERPRAVPAEPPLSAVEPGRLLSRETPSAVTARPGPRYSPWQWMLIGTGAAAVVAGGLLTYFAKAQNDEVGNAATFPDGTVRLDAMSRQDALSRHASAQQKMDGAIALYAVGGVAVVAGVVLAILDSRDPASSAPATVSMVPVQGGALVGATGRF